MRGVVAPILCVNRQAKDLSMSGSNGDVVVVLPVNPLNSPPAEIRQNRQGHRIYCEDRICCAALRIKRPDIYAASGAERGQVGSVRAKINKYAVGRIHGQAYGWRCSSQIIDPDLVI